METKKTPKMAPNGTFWEILSIKLVEHIGLEPMTFCMPCRRSSQLS